MKSSSLRTAVVALLEIEHPTTYDRDTLLSYSDALSEMAAIAEGVGKPVTARRYRQKAAILLWRAS